MLLMPPTIDSTNSFGPTILRGIYRTKAVTSPANAPSDRPAVGFSPIASEKGTPEDHYYFCNIAKKEGKRLSLLTEELLTIASSNNGSLVYNISDCELDSIIIDCYEAFYAPAKKKNINLAAI